MNLQTKVLICVFLFVFLLPLLSAEDSFVFKKATESQFNVPCVDSNEAPCSSSISCNLTVLDPNGIKIIDNSPMTFSSNGFFNYNLNTTETATSGSYYTSIGCTGTENGLSTLSYFVNSSGSKFDSSKSIFYIGTMFILFFLFIATLFGVGALPNGRFTQEDTGEIIGINSLRHFRIVLVGIAWGILTMLSFLAFNVAEGYLSTGLVSGIFQVIFTILMTISLIGIPVVFGYILWRIVQDVAIKKMIERGIYNG